MLHPSTEVFRFDDETFEVRLSSVDAVLGEQVQIYSAERTFVDPGPSHLNRVEVFLAQPDASNHENRWLTSLLRDRMSRLVLH